MSNFKQVSIINTKNDQVVMADVLKGNDKSMTVALHGTTTKLTLVRTDTNKVFVGNLHGMEFTSTGE